MTCNHHFYTHFGFARQVSQGHLGAEFNGIQLAAFITYLYHSPCRTTALWILTCRPLNSHGLAVRLKVFKYVSRSHGKRAISHGFLTTRKKRVLLVLLLQPKFGHEPIYSYENAPKSPFRVYFAAFFSSLDRSHAFFFAKNTLVHMRMSLRVKALLMKARDHWFEYHSRQFTASFR